MILGQQRRMMPRPHRTVAAPALDKVGDIIPYDYGATFDITGRPGNVVQDVINISAEGAFVAVAVGYGLEEDRGRALQPKPIPQQGDNLPSGSVLPGDITLGELPADALITGFGINPRFEPHLFGTSGFDQNGSRAARNERRFSDQPLPAGFLVAESVFQRIKPRSEISFLLSILDSGSGRELQDEPTHNLASLGTSDGERPFRLLAQPITFNPRSTIRLQIIERSQGVVGRLFIVFYGYKLLGTSACPEPVGRSLSGPAACPIETIGSPSARVIPFDYVARLELTGRRQNVVETETTINAEGGFVASSVGYGLLVEETAVRLRAMGGISGHLSGVPITTGSIRHTRRNVSRNFTPDGSGDFSISPLETGDYEITYAGLPVATVRVEPDKISRRRHPNQARSRADLV